MPASAVRQPVTAALSSSVKPPAAPKRRAKPATSAGCAPAPRAAATTPRRHTPSSAPCAAPAILPGVPGWPAPNAALCLNRKAATPASQKCDIPDRSRTRAGALSKQDRATDPTAEPTRAGNPTATKPRANPPPPKTTHHPKPRARPA